MDLRSILMKARQSIQQIVQLEDVNATLRGAAFATLSIRMVSISGFHVVRPNLPTVCHISTKMHYKKVGNECRLVRSLDFHCCLYGH